MYIHNEKSDSGLIDRYTGENEAFVVSRQFFLQLEFILHFIEIIFVKKVKSMSSIMLFFTTWITANCTAQASNFNTDVCHVRTFFDQNLSSKFLLFFQSQNGENSSCTVS